MGANGMCSGAEWVFTHILVPSGQGTINAARMLGNLLTASAETAYRNALLPVWGGLTMIAKGCFYSCVAVAHCFGIAASGVYEHVLVPMPGIVAKGAEVIYMQVLAPCGMALGAVVSVMAQSRKHGARALYVHVIL